MFSILWFLIHFYFFYFLAFVFPLFLFRIFLLDFYCFKHFVITRFHVFVAIVCDDGWVPYNNQCYLFSSSVDIFPNAVVRFDFTGFTKLVIIISKEIIYCIMVVICLKHKILNFIFTGNVFRKGVKVGRSKNGRGRSVDLSPKPYSA